MILFDVTTLMFAARHPVKKHDKKVMIRYLWRKVIFNAAKPEENTMCLLCFGSCGPASWHVDVRASMPVLVSPFWYTDTVCVCIQDRTVAESQTNMLTWSGGTSFLGLAGLSSSCRR